MFSKSRTVNFSIVLVLGIISFFVIGGLHQIEHTKMAENLVKNINYVNHALLKLDQLQQHVLLNHERIINTAHFNPVQNYQFFTLYRDQYLQLFTDLTTNTLVPYISTIQLNQLNSYHTMFVDEQSRLINNFEFSNVTQEKIQPSLQVYSLLSIEFIEFVHQTKHDLIQNNTEITTRHSNAFMASERYTFNLLILSLVLLLLASAAITYFFYLNTYLYQHIRGLYQQSTKALLTIDEKGTVTQFNPMFSQIFSHLSLRKHDTHIKHILGNHWTDIAKLLQPFAVQPFGFKRLVAVLNDPSEPVLSGRVNYNMSISTALGIRTMVLDIKLIQIFTKFRAVITFNDQSQQEAIQAQVNLDTFTQIFNKTTILASLEDELERCKRHHLLLSIIFIDIDEFKSINDRYGHPFGDKVIKWVAASIKKRVRDTDFLGRYGGDEFLIVCPDCDSVHARIIAQNILALLQTPKLHVKASIGVAQMESDDTSELLLRRADIALYEAKNQGKNKVVIYKQQSQR